MATGDADELLRALILRDEPAVADGPDWDRVVRLRDWTSRNLVAASPSAELGTVRPRLYVSSAAEAFTWMFRREGGVWCGGAAHVFAQVCRLFGHEAWTYDHGLPGVMTHVVTLVRVRDGGRCLIAVLDPYFNTAWTDAAGRPIDVFDLLDAVGRGGGAVVRRGPPPRRPYLLDAADDRAACISHLGPDDRPVARPSATRELFDTCFDLEAFDRAFGPAVRGELQSRGHPPDPARLLLSPLGVGKRPGDSRRSADELLARLRERAARPPAAIDPPSASQ